MNILYKGLIGLALIAGCDNSALIRDAYHSGIAEAARQCTLEKEQLSGSLEQKLKQQLASAAQELAKAKAEAQTTCDARVKEAIAQYAPKPVEAAEDMTSQFPKMDEPMHGLLKGMAQGKYETLYDSAEVDYKQDSLELPLLYKGYVGERTFRVTSLENCSGKATQIDLPAEHTACQVGSAVLYNPQDNMFQIDSWKTHSVKIDSEYQNVTESVSYKGTGQTLGWEEVRTVEFSTQHTQYQPHTVTVSNMEKTVVEGHAAKMNALLSGLLAKGEEYVKKAERVPTFEAKKDN